MQVSTQENTEQYADTAKALLEQLQEQLHQVLAEHPEIGPAELPITDLGANFSWPANVILQGTPVWAGIQICCLSQPPIKATSNIFGISGAVGGVSSGTCQFKVPASVLPSLGELAIQVNISPAAVSIAFFNGATLLGVFVGNNLILGIATFGGKCQFENGVC